MLPKGWSICQAEMGFRVNLFSSVKSHVVQRTVFCGYMGDVQVVVHGHELPPSHSVYKDIGCVKLSAGVSSFVTHVMKSVSQVRLYEICVGAHLQKFKLFWKSSLDTCSIDSNNFHEARYCETLRANSCELLVPQRAKHCKQCSKILVKFANRKMPTPSKTNRTPNKFKPFKVLSSAEKAAGHKRSAKRIVNLQRQVARLKNKLSEVIHEKGVNIDSELSEELSSTLNAEMERLHSKGEKFREDQFFEIFIQQQLKARSLGDSRGMKWHPLMIRFAIQLKMSGI